MSGVGSHNPGILIYRSRLAVIRISINESIIITKLNFNINLKGVSVWELKNSVKISTMFYCVWGRELCD